MREGWAAEAARARAAAVSGLSAGAAGPGWPSAPRPPADRRGRPGRTRRRRRTRLTPPTGWRTPLTCPRNRPAITHPPMSSSYHAFTTAMQLCRSQRLRRRGAERPSYGQGSGVEAAASRGLYVDVGAVILASRRENTNPGLSAAFVMSRSAVVVAPPAPDRTALKRELAQAPGLAGHLATYSSPAPESSLPPDRRSCLTERPSRAACKALPTGSDPGSWLRMP